MDLVFSLAWQKGPLRRAFKSDAAHALFLDYVERTGRLSPCRVTPIDGPGKAAEKVVVCHPSRPAKSISSEQLAELLEKWRDTGVRQTRVAVGPPDGFSEEDLQRLKPDFIWSFGPLTLPHELAAVVAAEQVYRAFTIVRGMPYHLGH